jgi:hypothetical protein
MDVEYSNSFSDDLFEYRYVAIKEKQLFEYINKLHGNALLEEHEWRAAGITQSKGWVHVFNYGENLVFRRLLPEYKSEVDQGTPESFIFKNSQALEDISQRKESQYGGASSSTLPQIKQAVNFGGASSHTPSYTHM